LITGLHYFIIFLSSFIIFDAVKENKNYEKHPTYVAVTQIDFNSRDKFAILLCKTFKDDLVSALQRKFSQKETITNPVDLRKLSAEMEGYIKTHLQIKINGKQASFSFINYMEDKENNSVAMHFRINNIDSINRIEITDTVFYELYDSQIQIIYITVDGNRKSKKLRNPASDVAFDF
jgi:hypothetical protein